MILRTIYCSVDGCNESYSEIKYGEGFPGWGLIQGYKTDTGETDSHLCPKHLKKSIENLHDIK